MAAAIYSDKLLLVLFCWPVLALVFALSAPSTSAPCSHSPLTCKDPTPPYHPPSTRSAPLERLGVRRCSPNRPFFSSRLGAAAGITFVLQLVEVGSINWDSRWFLLFVKGRNCFGLLLFTQVLTAVLINYFCCFLRLFEEEIQ